jgi:hypothetical protein
VGEKPADVFRLAYGNINGFHVVEHTNPKANELRHWIWCMEVDFFAGNESKNQLVKNAKVGPAARIIPFGK